MELTGAIITLGAATMGPESWQQEVRAGLPEVGFSPVCAPFSVWSLPLLVLCPGLGPLGHLPRSWRSHCSCASAAASDVFPFPFLKIQWEVANAWRVTLSVVHPLTDEHFWSTGQKGEKDPGSTLCPYYRGCSSLFSAIHQSGDFFRMFPISSVSTQWGSWRKSLQKNLGFPYVRALGVYMVLPVNTWPPATPQASELNSRYLCPTPTQTNQCSNVLSLQYLSLPEVWATWLPWNLSTMIYSRRTVNLFVQLVFLVRLGATQFPAFYHLQMKNCLFLDLKGFGPGSLLYYLGQVLTSPSVSSSLLSQDYSIIDNQMWQGIWRCLGIDKALYICRLSKAWWHQLLLSKKQTVLHWRENAWHITLHVSQAMLYEEWFQNLHTYSDFFSCKKRREINILSSSS